MQRNRAEQIQFDFQFRFDKQSFKSHLIDCEVYVE